MPIKEGCPNCGKTINIGQTPCPHCGAPLATRMEGAPVIADPVWGAKYCSHCGTVARPVTRTQGSFIMEVFLWLCFLLPGLIYSIWRLTTRATVCPGCGMPNMLPLDSPHAKAALAAQR